MASSALRGMRAQLEAAVRRDTRIAQGASDEVLRRKVDGFYWPLFRWIEEVIDRTKSSSARLPSRPCVCIGLSCVQGGGKTTATQLLREMLQLTGRRCAVLSLDDVYLTRQQQIALAEANPSNPLLQHRGNPSTHDLPLLMRFIEQCNNTQGEVGVPQYDKSLHEGRGDRVSESSWEKTQAPLDVLLIEGWCMGFRALHSMDGADPNLTPVNEALKDYERLYEALDAMVVIKVDSPDWVYKWREEQEVHLRNAGKTALSPNQVRDFVDRFMPAYKAYLPGLYGSAPLGRYASSNVEKIPTLVLEIDASRTPSLSSRPVERNIHSQALQQFNESDA